MSLKHVHIIAFDVPYPADYGGVIDIYYKIKALQAQGIKVHLHCFEYGRKKTEQLMLICHTVNYYKRNMRKKQLFSSIPFIVISRASEKLMQNLLKDDYPVIFEGLHTCYHLADERIKNRIKIVRTHNVEHTYYKGLERFWKSALKQFYFREEAEKLKKFEKVLHHANHIAAISKADADELASRYLHVTFIGAFHPYNEVNIKEGMGDYCLYHGNLSVEENNKAALFLMYEVFSKINLPLIIAGKGASEKLVRAVNKCKHIQLKENVDDITMLQLVQNAQLNVLPAFQSTGIKLKLLTALFNGRHCIVNTEMVVNIGLKNLCSVNDTPEEMSCEIEKLFKMPVNEGEKVKRDQELLNDFCNKENARKIIQLIESQF
jgi:hypothetical protein